MVAMQAGECSIRRQHSLRPCRSEQLPVAYMDVGYGGNAGAIASRIPCLALVTWAGN
jgi:hypothetical protein